MLNIEKYRDRLGNYSKSLDCDIQKIKGKYKEKNDFCGSKSCYECRKENIKWLLSEAQILDDAEKRYLRGVIRPFKNMVVFIKKTCNYASCQWIEIAVEGNRTIALPGFKNDEMYKGMKLEKEYTIEELDL